MNKQYLLTYQDDKHNYGTFAWFDSEEEMHEFIEQNDVHVIEGLHITSAKIIGTIGGF